MATYKGIQGNRVQSLASDPPASVGLGQLWYNSASNVWKVGREVTAWVSGGTTNTVRTGGAGFGALAAAQGMSGASGGPTTYTLNSEQYDGTSWTEVANMLTARRSLGAVGTQTAGIAFGGKIQPPNAPTDKTESWNGSSWTEVTAMNTGREICPLGAVSTAALAVGGPPTVTPQALTEEWDGTSWSAAGALVDGRNFQKLACGTTTAGLAVAGDNNPASPRDTTNCEEYNGTAWAEVNNCINARRDGAAVGTQTSAISYGGNNLTVNPIPNSEEYDGTSWSNTASSPANPQLGIFSNMGGVSNAGLQITGELSNIVEEYALGSVVKTVTTS